MNYLPIFLLLLTSLTVSSLEIQAISSPSHYESVIKTKKSTITAIFFVEELLADLKWFLEEIGLRGVVYTHNCQAVKASACELNSPFVAYYNQNILPYRGRKESLQDIMIWFQLRVDAYPLQISSYEELVSELDQKGDIFCLSVNSTAHEDKDSLIALQKNYPFLGLCLVEDRSLNANLSLQFGNFTHFRGNLNSKKSSTYPGKYETWENFMFLNAFPWVDRVDSLVGERFTLQPKNISVFILACDNSLHCEKSWDSIQHAKISGIKQKLMVLLLGDKETSMFQLYYHIKLEKALLPALIYVSLESNTFQNGELNKYVKYLPNEIFTLSALRIFIEEIKTHSLTAYELCELPRPKNGFTGKGSEKKVQKVSSRSLLENFKISPHHYLVLFTALGISCAACDKFYQDFKQAASFFKDSGIVFAVLNVVENEIPVQQIEGLPNMLLFKKQERQSPILFRGKYEFNNLLGFLKEELEIEEEEEEL